MVSIQKCKPRRTSTLAETYRSGSATPQSILNLAFRTWWAVLKKLIKQTPSGKFSAIYPAEILPSWFGQVFAQTVTVYAMSAAKAPIQSAPLPVSLAKLISDYFLMNGVSVSSQRQVADK